MATETKDIKEKKFNYRSNRKPIWCPGCGDHSVVAGLARALEAMELNPADIAVVSGIGCSSRLPGYMSTYGFNSIHGRALPIATGLKLSRPEITVIAAGGDGDGFAIGGNHLMHAARRNIDITYLVMDNGIYGLTKGQVSPTTPLGLKTKTTSYGSYEKPIRPLEVMLAYGTTFVAQAYSADLKRMTELIQEAIEYPGFSYVNIISPCVTYRGGKDMYQSLKAIMTRVEDSGHDVHDWEAAHRISCDDKQMHVGVIYKERRDTYLEIQHDLKEKAPHAEALAVADIANNYR